LPPRTALQIPAHSDYTGGSGAAHRLEKP
jgi:hypothetical protein